MMNAEMETTLFFSIHHSSFSVIPSLLGVAYGGGLSALGPQETPGFTAA
jgi:hypothetical protein